MHCPNLQGTNAAKVDCNYAYYIIVKFFIILLNQWQDNSLILLTEQLMTSYNLPTQKS